MKNTQWRKLGSGGRKVTEISDKDSHLSLGNAKSVL